VSTKKIKTKVSKRKVSNKSLKNSAASGSAEQCSIDILTPDCLELISCFLDTKSALSLYQTSKSINLKLQGCVHFWKHLCKNENFDEYNALKNKNNDDEAGEEETPRMSWSGEKFHDVQTAEDSTFWHRVFLRGIEMRRNIVNGKFEMWRLFMTDPESLPVKRMSKDTSFRELRSQHRNSPFNDHRRRVRIHRYWNEDYLIAIQHTVNHAFNDIFVWSWNECQNPTFLYSHDLSTTYPTGLFPTSFFLWKRYLVLMPETGYIQDERKLSSMIRVHDLSRNFELIGKYDFPENGLRRHLKITTGNEAAHLHKLGDKAVALCRTPKLNLFVFSLPSCDLVQTVALPENPERPLELDDLDQRFLMKDNTMMFMFHHPDFFNHLFTSMEGGTPLEKKYGRLMIVDFDNFLKTNGEIEMRVDSQFDSNEDYIEKISVISKSKMACVLMSGKIVVRNIMNTGCSSITYMDSLTIPCPEQLQDEFDTEFEELDTDGPNLCTSSSGDLIIVLRHFTKGRKIHCYSSKGDLLYSLEVDDPALQLEKQPGYLSMDLDGNFLCAADQNRIVLWNSRTGAYVNTIVIPQHYNYRDDPEESADKYCWKGHTDFAFTEDGIIIIHSQRNFPIAADVLLFW